MFQKHHGNSLITSVNVPTPIPINLHVDSELISDPNTVATAFNQFFVSVANTGLSQSRSQSTCDLEQVDLKRFLFPVCELEVENVIRNLPSNTTPYLMAIHRG